MPGGAMEIERKWMVAGWPETEFPMVNEQFMRQGYISVGPTVRIREESETGGMTEYIVCFKSRGTLARKEIEISVPEDKFRELEDLIDAPLIPKLRRSYQLPDGLVLEVNHVDEGLPTEFWYAEVEFESILQAKTWEPESAGLEGYLKEEVTSDPTQTMGAYWLRTRAGRS